MSVLQQTGMDPLLPPEAELMEREADSDPRRKIQFSVPSPVPIQLDPRQVEMVSLHGNVAGWGMFRGFCWGQVCTILDVCYSFLPILFPTLCSGPCWAPVPKGPTRYVSGTCTKTYFTVTFAQSRERCPPCHLGLSVS